MREARALALLFLVVLPSCRAEPPPSYLRVEGPAPVLQAAPTSRATLVVFWAAWCAPCREETPQLRALAEAPPEGLSVVVFSHDTGMKAVEDFLGGPAEAALHLRLDEGEAAARAFGVDKLPTSLLVVGGRLVARFQGPRDWNSRAMRRLLEKLIREPSARLPASAD
jgi:cytochrome c biogenesis protein CcmG/thiol:disulfide interchange protein DsbE